MHGTIRKPRLWFSVYLPSYLDFSVVQLFNCLTGKGYDPSNTNHGSFSHNNSPSQVAKSLQPRRPQPIWAQLPRINPIEVIFVKQNCLAGTSSHELQQPLVWKCQGRPSTEKSVSISTSESIVCKPTFTNSSHAFGNQECFN
jgi:hypothetical protein